MSTVNRKPKVFLSYAREDGASAARLCESLRDHNRNVWFDQDSIRGGEPWRAAIERAIRDSDFFVALLSDVSVNKRGTVQAELKKALEVLDELPEGRVFFIPTRLTPCEPTHPRVRELQWIDLFPVWEGGLNKLVLATEPAPGGSDDSGPAAPFSDPPHVEPGGQLFQATEVRVSELVQQAIAAVRVYADARRIEVTVRDEAPGVKVRVPPDSVVQAMTNVLHNALKYSYTSPERAAPIEVTIQTDRDTVRIDFTDIGVGLLSDETNRVFELGYRGRDAMSSSLGQGVGLWLARSFLQSAQGDIRIESRPLRTGFSKSTTPFLTRVSIHLVRVRNHDLPEAG